MANTDFIDSNLPVLPKPKSRETDGERPGVKFNWDRSDASLIDAHALENSRSEFGIGGLAGWLGRAFGGHATLAGSLLLSKAGPWLIVTLACCGIVAVMAGGASLMTRNLPPARGAANSTFHRPRMNVPPAIQEGRESNSGIDGGSPISDR